MSVSVNLIQAKAIWEGITKDRLVDKSVMVDVGGPSLLYVMPTEQMVLNYRRKQAEPQGSTGGIQSSCMDSTLPFLNGQ